MNPTTPRSEPGGSWEGAVRAGQAGPEADGLPVAVMRTDKRLRPVQTNTAWQALTPTGEITGEGEEWLRLFDAQDQRRVRDSMRTVLATQRTESLEVRGGSDDQWLEVRIAPDEWRSGVYVVALDISEQRRRESLLNYYAIHDPLTGLHNRIALLQHARVALARLRRAPSILAVLYIDLDHFKEVNDRYGHETGDRVLVEAAQRLRIAIRPTDMVARVGGDEFVAVCESFESEAEVRGVADRLVSSINEPIRVDATTVVRLGVAIGVIFAVNHTESAASLIDRADQAMYESKRGGGNLVHAAVQGPAGGPAPAPDAAVSKAVGQLAGVEGDLLEEWARSASTEDDSGTGRLRSASKHVARAIAVLGARDSRPRRGKRTTRPARTP
jgi:diguanylate cyclase (GGDEF)-like protein